MFGRLFYWNGGKYRYDGMNHQFTIGSTLWQVWVAKGSNTYSKKDKLNLYESFQIYLIRSHNMQRMLLCLDIFKPRMLLVAPQKMSLGGFNQVFMTSRIVSSDDKIPSMKSSDMGDLTAKMIQLIGSYSSIKGIV